MQKPTKIKQNKKGEMLCPFCCRALSGAEQLKEHLKSTHWPEERDDVIAVRLRYINQLLDKTVRKSPQKSYPPKNFKIISARGQKVYGEHTCDLCGASTNINWHYTLTSKGEVTICPSCKDRFRPRRIPYKNIIKTSVESSGKRH